MALITEPAIKKAKQRVAAGRASTVTLSDPAPRGSGRLLLVVKPSRSEWYAQRWSDGQRRLQKIGTWPEMTIAQARERNGAVGLSIAPARASVGELFDAYVKTLEGRESHSQARLVLAEAGETIGRSRLARDITATDIVAAVRKVYLRGAIVSADKHRAYLSAAFGWAVRSANDYTQEDGGRQWGVTRNPVSDVPQDAKARRVGEKWLRPPQFVLMLEKLMVPGAESRTAAALQLLTGQRGPQVRAIHVGHWDRDEGVLSWPKMKNGRPHAIPVPQLAADLLNGLTPDASGWLLGPIDRSSVSWTLRATGLGVTSRDLRRTWKTLAGAAGLTKSERDQYQHHGVTGDVAERNYNRWDGLPEKRAAVAKWDAWLHEQLRQHGTHREAEEVVQPQEHGGGE